jgi:hypothetical protein
LTTQSTRSIVEQGDEVIHKTQRVFSRRVATYRDPKAHKYHEETVLRESWLLLGFIVLYARETITSVSQ